MADSFAAKSTGPVQVAKAAIPEAQEYSQQDIEDAVRLFGALGSRPDLIPTTFLAYLQDYFSSADPLTLTTNSLLDFSRFTANVSDMIDTDETTSSVVYTDLVNVGPTLSALPDGRYVVIAICAAAAGLDFSGNRGKGTARMSVSVNGGTAQDAWCAQSANDLLTSVWGLSIQNLTAGSNTIQAKYRIETGASVTGEFRNRILLALRFSNN